MKHLRRDLSLARMFSLKHLVYGLSIDILVVKIGKVGFMTASMSPTLFVPIYQQQPDNIEVNLAFLRGQALEQIVLVWLVLAHDGSPSMAAA